MGSVSCIEKSVTALSATPWAGRQRNEATDANRNKTFNVDMLYLTFFVASRHKGLFCLHSNTVLVADG